MDKHLHIVSFDVPFPADYGGVIDVFYKIVWLHKQGVKIHLHCFTKGRAAQPELEKYCEEVHYYERKTEWKGFSFSLPYIVSSRKSKALLTELKKDNHPVLFEGIHTTYWLCKNELKGRQIFIRLHNVEYKYYRQLAQNESSFFKRSYFNIESAALKKYEKNISSKAFLLPMSTADAEVYREEFNAAQMKEITVFTPWNVVLSIPGDKGPCVYHGNLSVNENEKAALWLIQKVFSDIDTTLIITGKSPSSLLEDEIMQVPNFILYPNPSDEELSTLLQNAFIHVIPSFNSTGIKLKLLNALFNGRHCLVNHEAVEGSGLEELCTIAGTADDFKNYIELLRNCPFTEEDIAKKKAVLYEKYSNEKNSLLLMSLLH